MSIHNIKQKIKPIYEQIKSSFTSLITIVIVGFGSFYLGRISNEAIYSINTKTETINTQKEVKQDQVSIQQEKEEEDLREEQKVTLKEGKYLASKNGKIYYPMNCKSAARIKSANRVYFKSASDAEYVGYKQTKSCKY